MANTSPSLQYDIVAKFFHWLTVFLIITQFAVAWTMPDISRGTEPTGLISWHLSVGAAILLTALVRLAWRLTHRAPPPPGDLSPVLQTVSRTTHFLLYALLVILPVMGWANASARGWTNTLFGFVPLPALLDHGSLLGRRMGDIHATTALILLAVIALHVAGALYHALILRDRTVQRML